MYGCSAVMLTVRDGRGPVIGYIERYTETERPRGRWSRRGQTVERVYWRAIPFETGQPITYHIRKRDALAAVRKCGNDPTP